MRPYAAPALTGDPVWVMREVGLIWARGPDGKFRDFGR